MAADGGTMATLLEALRARRDAARLDAERERLTKEDIEEAALRAEIAQHEEAARRKDAEARSLALTRREEAARDALGPKIPIAGMEADAANGEVHTFVVKHNARAFSTWERRNMLTATNQKDPATGKKVDRAENNRTFALAVVYDWNGKIIVDGSGDFAELTGQLTEFPGLASMIAVAASRLAGYALEERKS